MGAGAAKPGVRSINALHAVHRFKRLQQSTVTPRNEKDSETNNISVQNSVHFNMIKNTQNQEISPGIEGMDDVKCQSSGIYPVVTNGEEAAAKEEDRPVLVGNPNKQETNAPVKQAGGEDEEEVKQVKTVWTPEEIAKKKAEYLSKAVLEMENMKTDPVYNLEEEGKPYTATIRNNLLLLARCYFYFKIGQIPYPEILNYRESLASALCTCGAATKICDIITKAFNEMDFINEEGEMVNSRWFPVKNSLMTLLNFSDCSEEVKVILTDHPGFVASAVKVLNDHKERHLKKELSENRNKMLRFCLSILHNCGAKTENIPRLRELGVLQAVLPYVESPLEQCRLSAIAALSNLVNEEEAELLKTHTSMFRFIVKKLQRAIKSESHKDVGWSALELIIMMRQLSCNDSNKKILVNEGCLIPLISVLEVGSEKEIKEAINCLWMLSFDMENKERMTQEPQLVEKIYDMYCSGCGATRHSCHGVLWSIREEMLKSEKYHLIGSEIKALKSTARPLQTSSAGSANSHSSQYRLKGHVMLSYQWDNQEVIKQISQELRAHNIPVWIDIDYMGGSTLQAMAKAVEDSFAVIIAMSQRYKDSPNTRAEAEYAFQQRKKIIPLIMQRGYRPDGWLGLILGSKLYYDFSGKYSFESRFEGLLKAVTDLYKQSDEPDGAVTVKPVEESKAPTLLAPPRPIVLPSPLSPQVLKGQNALRVPPIDEDAINKWTEKDKEQWLSKHKLQKSSLRHLSTEEIIFLHNLRNEAPEFFYHCLETKLHLVSFIDLANATKALTDLSP